MLKTIIRLSFTLAILLIVSCDKKNPYLEKMIKLDVQTADAIINELAFEKKVVFGFEKKDEDAYCVVLYESQLRSANEVESTLNKVLELNLELQKHYESHFAVNPFETIKKVKTKTKLMDQIQTVEISPEQQKYLNEKGLFDCMIKLTTRQIEKYKMKIATTENNPNKLAKNKTY